MIVRLSQAIRRKSGEVTLAVEDPRAVIHWGVGITVDGDTLIPWGNILYVEGFHASAEPERARRAGRGDSR